MTDAGVCLYSYGKFNPLFLIKVTVEIIKQRWFETGCLKTTNSDEERKRVQMILSFYDV
jgi:hypothetical protein